MLAWESVFANRAERMRASEIRELLKLLDKPDIISFAGGIPDPALFPGAAFQQAYAQILAGPEAGAALQYSISEGYKPLREWLVGHLAEIGIECCADNILITSGSQQALDYVGKLFLSPGDTALVNWPTYLGALQAFNAYEPSYDRLATGGNRTPASYLEAARQAGGRVKFAYACADFANPTGATLSLPERERLLDLADELDIALVEDAAYQSLRYEGEAIAPILALDIARKGNIEASRTIYCGSFSKTLSPGLRVGFICAAGPVIRRLVLMKQAGDLHSATINQMAVERVARERFGEQVSRCRAAYRERRDNMLAALERHMPAGTQWTRPEGGMFVFVTLPGKIDGAELLVASLASERVAFVPGRAFFADATNANTLRLSFSCANPGMIEEGISRLGRLVGRHMEMGRPFSATS